LQRLESVLATPDQPCLLEEVMILAQELGGLGDMLQLPAFSQLCLDVTQHLTIAPDQVSAIAQAALHSWRTSQTLVLTGQFDQLPTAIALPAGETPPLWERMPKDIAIDRSLDRDGTMPASGEEGHTGVDSPVNAEGDTDPVFETLIDAPIADVASGPIDVAAFFDELQVTQPLAGTPVDLPTTDIPATPVPIADRGFRLSDSDPAAPTAQTVQFQDSSPDAAGLNTPAEDENATVRVAVRQLNQLNDLFGELAIERNGLELYLQRLRNLTRSLGERVQRLDQSNAEMRAAYDRGSLQKPTLLLPGAVDESTAAMDSPDPTLRLDMGRSDPGRFDALELDRYSDLHLLSQDVMETIVQIQEIASDIDISLDDTDQTVRNLNKTSRQLQTNLTQLRMRPLADIVDRFPRALRELCLQHGKKVNLDLKGTGTLIDRNILESLQDPLMHLLRNAFDHGMEASDQRRSQGKPDTGTIEIAATQRHNRTIITIRDDGRGIPLDKIRQRAAQMGLDPTLLADASDQDLLSLIFEPGFSTSDQVTDLSGRGVGLDVVRDNLKQVRGDIKVDTAAGKGTTFTLSVPFTLSIVRILLAESQGMLLAFPSDAIGEIGLLRSDAIVATPSGDRIQHQGRLAPVVHLSRWLQFNCPRQAHNLETQPTINSAALLWVNSGPETVALHVDRCWGEQEVTVRRVEGNLPLSPGFSSCTILGDGRIVPLVNTPELLRWIASSERSQPLMDLDATRLNLPAHLLSAPQPVAKAPTTILIVDDSINVRRFLALTLEQAGYRTEQAKDGQDALEKLQANLPVQAVICDIEMPRLDGFGLLTRLKANPSLPKIPIAMLTSRSGEKHRQLAMSLGATAYFSKPYNEQELLQTIAAMTAAAGRVASPVG
jgi:two-component system, chemotaxis family, sensor histidine kinase and response regulator PixL